MNTWFQSRTWFGCCSDACAVRVPRLPAAIAAVAATEVATATRTRRTRVLPTLLLAVAGVPERFVPVEDEEADLALRNVDFNGMSPPIQLSSRLATSGCRMRKFASD